MTKGDIITFTILEALLPDISKLFMQPEASLTTHFMNDQEAKPQAEYYDIDISPTSASSNQGGGNKEPNDHSGFP